MRGTFVWVLCVGGLDGDLLERNQLQTNPEKEANLPHLTSSQT